MIVRGFTLLELLVVLTMIGILLAVGIPRFDEYIRTDRITVETKKLISNLNYARNEASTRRSVVTLGATTQGDWSQGWKIYTDADTGGNSAYDDSTDTLLRDISASTNTGITINSSDSAQQWISYKTNGMLNESSAVVLSVCDDRGDGLDINISITGRLYMSASSEPCSS